MERDIPWSCWATTLDVSDTLEFSRRCRVPWPGSQAACVQFRAILGQPKLRKTPCLAVSMPKVSMPKVSMPNQAVSMPKDALSRSVEPYWDILGLNWLECTPYVGNRDLKLPRLEAAKLGLAAQAALFSVQFERKRPYSLVCCFSSISCPRTQQTEMQVCSAWRGITKQWFEMNSLIQADRMPYPKCTGMFALVT